jgi:predicted small integral membrane protein
MGWMAWTLPTALFFLGIASLLGVYTVWGIRSPSAPRQGFLPMPTTRGDRLFVGLLASAYVNLAWAGLLTAPQWFAMAIWIPLMWVIGRWG